MVRFLPNTRQRSGAGGGCNGHNYKIITGRIYCLRWGKIDLFFGRGVSFTHRGAKDREDAELLATIKPNWSQFRNKIGKG
jgi:hypothetical protein